MKLDFDKNVWSFKMSNGNCYEVNGRDGITVKLQVGAYEGAFDLDAATKTVLKHRM